MDNSGNEWQPMSTAPRNATEIEVSTDLRSTVAHWAEGDGENVPPFRGWFEAIRKSDGKVSHYLEIEPPHAWRPIQPTTPTGEPR